MGGWWQWAVGGGWWWAPWYNDFDINLTHISSLASNAVPTHGAVVYITLLDASCSSAYFGLCCAQIGGFSWCQKMGL